MQENFSATNEVLNKSKALAEAIAKKFGGKVDAGNDGVWVLWEDKNPDFEEQLHISVNEDGGLELQHRRGEDLGFPESFPQSFSIEDILDIESEHRMGEGRGYRLKISKMEKLGIQPNDMRKYVPSIYVTERYKD